MKESASTRPVKISTVVSSEVKGFISEKRRANWEREMRGGVESCAETVESSSCAEKPHKHRREDSDWE